MPMSLKFSYVKAMPFFVCDMRTSKLSKPLSIKLWLYSFGKFISVIKSKIFDLLFLGDDDLNDVNIKGDSV